jgi:pimeloyl-ACP methyl ester carboxylesterase/DNA-binding CsgD family transcriptional regulator
MSKSTQQIRFCTSRDGTRIAYATCGQGPPLVWAPHWIHHLRFDWDSPIWRPWLTLLTRHHSLIYYDWRGCGLSDREHVQFAPDRYLEDFEAVIEATNVNGFALVGMGQGTRMAMTYAVRHPGQISRLVLMGPSSCGRVVQGQNQEQAEEEATRLRAIELGWHDNNPAYGRFFTSMHLPDATTEQIRAYDDLLRQTTSPANAIAMMRSFHRADVRDFVPRVRCPTLVLHSRGDFIIPFEWGRAVAAQIPGARLVPLESRNNFLLDTEPAWQQLVEEFEDFLSTSPSSSDANALALDELTRREREVLQILAEGLDNYAIAARLGISEKTVRNHVSVIFSKLEIKSRAQAVAFARDAGLGRRRDG